MNIFSLHHSNSFKNWVEKILIGGLIFSFALSPFSQAFAQSTTDVPVNASSENLTGDASVPSSDVSKSAGAVSDTPSVGSIDTNIIASPTLDQSSAASISTAPASGSLVPSIPPGPIKAPSAASSPSGNSIMPSEQPVAFTSFGPNVDKNTGALRMVFPIKIPPGRKNLQPDLNLVYNSQDNQFGSIFGEGWSISIPYISRLNKSGSDKLYSTSTLNYFTSSLDGELVATSTVSSTALSYVARTENGAFNKYTFASSTNQWTMIDKNGMQYSFGSTSDSQQSDPNNSARVFKWMLKQIKDTNNNLVIYNYVSDSGQIYPSSTFYTGTSTSTGIFEVDFLKQSRVDIATSSATGFGVSSRYLINEIDAKAVGSWVRKYVIGYTAGTNASTSLLSSITESGVDASGTVVTLPTSTLSYQVQAAGWTASTTWNPPVATLNWHASHDNGVRIVDANADNFVDVLQDINGSASAWTNNAAGWTASTTWNPPVSFLDTFSNNNNGVQIADVNGDGLPDFIQGVGDHTGASETLAAWINTKNGWTASTTWNPPVDFLDWYYGTDNGTRVVDLNGDGLPDIIQGITNERNGATSTFAAWINNGSGWTRDDSWDPPIAFLDWYNTRDTGWRIADVNGDGLPDIISVSDAYINTGHGWTEDASWASPISFWDNNSNNDGGSRIADVNGDGLPDLLVHSGGNPNGNANVAYINTGHGWTSSSTWDAPISFLDWLNNNDAGARIADVNGDGLPDMIDRVDDNPNGTSSVAYINNSTRRADLLTNITYSQGGSSSIAYQSVTQQLSGGNIVNKEPYSVYVVSQKTDNDGVQYVASTTYQYAGGTYYYGGVTDKQFAGFNTETETDSAGNVTKTYYHTGNGSDSSHGEYADNFWKIGKPYRIENYDNAGHLYKKTINKWDIASLGGAAAFVKLNQVVESDYDGLSTHDDSAVAYTFDNSTGNQIEKIEYGQVTGSDDGTFSDIGSDKFTTDLSYASSSTSVVIGKPSDVTMIDQSSVKVKESRFYYDTLSLGSIGAGNLTKQEDWKTGVAYINTQNTYNSYGLVTQSLDPLGKQTTYVYDGFNLYPATTTNALSQSTSYQYDYSLGKPTQTIDPNGAIFTTVYDGLDRPIAALAPDPNSGLTATTTAYIYTDTANAVSTHKIDYLTATSTVDTYTYYDGLSRLIQTRQAAEPAGTYKVADRVYNNINLLQKESLPYFSSGSSKTSATTTSALFIAYAYDPLQRLLTTTDAIGTTSNSYGNWLVTTTDPRGKTKDAHNDAFGNLIEVDEHNNSSTYTTTYTFNGLKALLNVTDALGNVRNFTYDGLGRRLSAQDLHASADTTFGSSTFAYDDSDNLTQTVDAKNQTINYTYDDINRPLTEDYTGQTGMEFQYVYDSCTQGKTRLCTVSSTDATINNIYNSLGQLIQESKTIGGIVYTTSYTYDRQGNQLSITNPDNSQIAYTYNTARLVETVSQKPNSGSWSTVVSNFDYSPTNQPITIAYANGVTQTNTYDPAQVYRLSHKVGTLPTGSHAQDMSYTYDADGNITQLVDTSISGTGKTVNYIYDDLSRLTNASTTSASSTPYGQSFLYDALGNITTGSAGAYVYAGNTGSNFADPDAVTSIAVSSSTGGGGGTTTYTPTIDASTTLLSLGFNSGPVTQTSTFTIAASSTIIVLTGDIFQDVAGTGSITAATWKGVSFTKIAANREVGMSAEEWYLAPTSTGSGTLSVTVTGATDEIKIGAASFAGVATSSLLDTTSSAIGISGNPSVNLTTATSSELVVATLSRYSTTGATSSRTPIYNDTSDQTLAAASYQVSTSSASYSDTYTGSVAQDWSMLIAAFKPRITSGGGSGSGTSTTNFTYDNSGNLLTTGNATNTWNYRNQLTQSVYASGSSTYAYDYQGQRVKLVEGGITTIFPSKFYNTTVGSASTSIEHIFANGILLATIQNGSSTTGGVGGGSSTSTPTLDATSTLISAGFNAGPVTMTSTLTLAGSSTLIFLNADIFQDVDGVGSVATATWKGVNFKKIGGTREVNIATEQWYLNPTSTGSGILSVTVTGATDDIKINAASFAGVSTSSPLDASSTAIGISGNPSVSITTTTSSDLVVATLMRYSTTNATSNRTSIYRDSTSQSLGAASYQLATSSGSYSDTYTGSVAQDWSMMISAFKAGMTVGSGGSSSSTASTTIRYVLADTLGGSNIVTDASGTVVETLDYYPYGAARLDTKTGSYVGEKRKFDSMERDSGSGLDYAQARYYDSSRGQFISEDPVFWGNPKSQNLTDPQSFNSYAFANGNPIARSDPTGLGAFDYTKGFFTGTGVYLREGVSGLNPFSVQTAYAPANQMSTVQPTKISTAPATNQSFNNGFTAGLDYTDKFSKVVSTIGFVVPIIGGSEVAAGLSQLQLNQLRGSAFEGQKFGELVQDYPGLQPQVTLQTQSGVTTRIDFMAQDTSGNYCLFECKSSPTAPLTKNQTLAFPEIQKSGATVLGNGKAGFPGGTQIPPTTVKVIRP